MILISFALLPASHADEKLRPQNYKEQLQSHKELTSDQATYQEHELIPGAHVAWADYQALRRDYPELFNLSDSEIDSWILQFARVSRAQLRLQGIRTTSFETLNSSSRPWLHPTWYNRAAVAATPGGRLIDLKGTGHKTETSVQLQVNKYQAAKILTDPQAQLKQIQRLQTDDHSDGMASLGEAIAEVLRQRAIQQSFDIYNRTHGTAYQTVENLFIIALPIGILKGQGPADQAAILGRQASWRGPDREIPEIKQNIYHDDHGHFQSTEMLSAIDFGGVVIANPDLESTFGPPSETLRTIISASGAKQIEDAQLSRAWIHSFETAKAYSNTVGANPQLARQMIENHIQSKLSPLQQKWQQVSSSSSRDVDLLKYLISRLFLTRGLAQQRVLEAIQSPALLRSLTENFQHPHLQKLPVDQRVTLLVSLTFQRNPQSQEVALQLVAHLDQSTLSALEELGKNNEIEGGIRESISQLLRRAPRCELLFQGKHSG